MQGHSPDWVSIEKDDVVASWNFPVILLTQSNFPGTFKIFTEKFF